MRGGAGECRMKAPAELSSREGAWQGREAVVAAEITNGCNAQEAGFAKFCVDKD